MGRQEVARKLTAILSMDVVGYSRLMGADEAGTLSALKAHRKELIEPEIAEHHGRIVGTAGDSVLVEFASVVDAVECAVDVQMGMAGRNAKVPEERRMEFRAGINLGDVIVEGDDIYGEGVNVAARLQALAEPGGVSVSGKVYDEVKNKVDLGYEYLGEQKVKNIAEPVRTYRVQIAPKGLGSALQSAPPLPDKPSIAVLPFENMSGDPEQEYFVDGIAEDIITELSRYRWLFVIARNTSFTFKGRAVDVKDVARELGVRYVMEGSVRKAGERVRISAQLIDATTGSHIWAERYDRDLADVFQVQDEITERVVGAIQPELISAEVRRAQRKPPENLDAWDYAVRGRWHVLRLAKEDNGEAQRLLSKALDLDHNCVPALAFLAYSYFVDVLFGWSEAPGDSLSKGKDLAQRAGNLDADDPWVQCALGLSQFVSKAPDKAIAHYEKAIDLNPSFALGYGYLGLQLAFAGQPEAAIEAGNNAIRLSPRDPELFHFLVAIATAHFVAGRYEEAVAWARKSILERPQVPGPQRLLSTSLAHLGRIAEAKEVLEGVLRITPHLTATAIRNAIHFKNSADLDRYLDGLAKAGLEE